MRAVPRSICVSGLIVLLSGPALAATPRPDPGARSLPAQLEAGAINLVVGAGAPLRGTVERTTRLGAARSVYRGAVAGHPDSWFILAVNGAVTVGEVSIPGGHYRIQQIPDDAGLRVTTVAPSERLNCLVDALRPVSAISQAVPVGAAGNGPAPLVDVLVAWTAAARQAVGGTAVIEAQVDTYLAYTDMVYEASGVAHRLRLVQTAETPDAETGNILTDVANLRNPTDGFADELHALRDASGADLVCLIVNSGSAGVGYQMQVLSTAFASSAFSVIGAGQGGLVFAHETGHNMGCGHNNVPGADTIFCYSFGHRTPDLVWNTIMSNPPGTHVDFFSSPNLSFRGQPLGVSGDGCPSNAADNVRSLNEAAPTVAAFRPTVVPWPCPGDLDGTGDVGFSDLLVLIAAWGPCGACPADLDGSGDVGFADVLDLIGAWGFCP